MNKKLTKSFNLLDIHITYEVKVINHEINANITKTLSYLPIPIPIFNSPFKVGKHLYFHINGST